MSNSIPKPVAVVVGDILGEWYYNHRQIEALFYESGAVGEVPLGNCREKIANWLMRASSDKGCNPHSLLGKVLEEYMEVDDQLSPDDQRMGRDRIKNMLERYGMSYQQGGRILSPASGAPSRSLSDILRGGDFTEIQSEFDRALDTVENNPRASITAACTILETLCRIYIEDEGLDSPPKLNVKPIWGIVQKHLDLDPASLEDKDLARILSGLSSIVDGIGSLRSHVGDAHGRGRKSYRPEPRHARLAMNASHTLVTFLLETWRSRRGA